MNKPNWILGIIILFVPSLFVMKYTAVPYSFYTDDVAIVKLAFQHTGQRVIEYDEIGALKERAKQYREQMKKKKQVRMNLKSKQSSTRERFPLAIEFYIDDKKIHEKEYLGQGHLHDMAAVVYYAHELKPGNHNIKVVMKDSKREGTEPFIFEDTVEFKSREVKVITFDKVKQKFSWSKNLTPILGREEQKREEG